MTTSGTSKYDMKDLGISKSAKMDDDTSSSSDEEEYQPTFPTLHEMEKGTKDLIKIDDIEDDDNNENNDENDENEINNDDDEGDEDDEDDMSGGAISDPEEDDSDAEEEPFIDDEDEGSSNIAKQTKSVKKSKRTTKTATATQEPVVEYGIDSDDEMEEDYFGKFESQLNDNYLVNFHPEAVVHNYDEIQTMVNVVRNKKGIIVDPLHRTIPVLTKYEKTRILGMRTKQLNSGMQPMLPKEDIPETIVDGYNIAKMELDAKVIPFIIRRPLPDGTSEYWKVSDLEVLY